jgi:molybdopterin converting factor small subunit
VLLVTAIAAITGIAAVSAISPVAAIAQDAPPSGDPMDNIAERLRQRGIDVSPEQIERGRRIMEDIRDGVPPDPNQLQQVFGDFRKQVEKQQQKRLQEELGATDDEWKALGPKIEKVRTLQRLVGDDAVGGSGGMLGGGPGRALLIRSADPNTPQADIETKSKTLQALLDDKQAKPESVTAALKAYREARVKARQDLVKARQELKDLLTVRQEAQLVTMGILE